MKVRLVQSTALLYQDRCFAAGSASGVIEVVAGDEEFRDRESDIVSAGNVPGIGGSIEVEDVGTRSGGAGFTFWSGDGLISVIGEDVTSHGGLAGRESDTTSTSSGKEGEVL